MAQLGLSEAGEALRDFFGPQLDASEGDGPDMMADALVERKHSTKDEAKKLVKDLLAAGSVVFRPGKRPGDVPADANVVGAQVGSEGYPVGAAVEMPKHGGYWQFK